MTKRTIAIIPARGGSKGLPRKNILPLNGKPLIAYSIEQALESNQINEVYVSTNDEEIAAIAKQFGANVIFRPEAISGDEATSESALIHALNELGSTQSIDAIVFLQCTSPIRALDDLDNALSRFWAEGFDSLLSVVPNHRFIWQQEGGKLDSINYDYTQRARRQDLAPQYMENGSFYIFKPHVLLTHNNRLGGKIGFYEMHENSAFEIDSPFDFELIASIMKIKPL